MKTTKKLRYPILQMNSSYAISVLVTAKLSSDMVKQLQCGLTPNSRLQSKSRVKSYMFILTRSKEEEKKKNSFHKLTLQSVSSAKFHFYLKCFIPLKESPKGRFCSAFMYKTNKWLQTDYHVIISPFSLVFPSIETNKQKTSGFLGWKMVFLEFGHCGFCFCKALIRKHFPFALLQSPQSKSTLKFFSNSCLALDNDPHVAQSWSLHQPTQVLCVGKGCHMLPPNYS